MDKLLNFFSQIPPNSFWWDGFKLFIAIIIITAIASSINLLLKYLVKYSKKSSIEWDDVIIRSVHGPLTLLVWILGLVYIVNTAELNSTLLNFDTLATLRKLGVIICLLWFALRFLKFSEQTLATQIGKFNTNIDAIGIRAINKILRVAVLITAVLMGFQAIGFSVSGILAFGGVGGIMVGFAAKDMLSNFFGGLMIYLDRPFTEGDWIRSPDREIEGVVEHIGWRQTRIRTFERRPVYVPNSIFAQIAVENPSRMENRRIRESIGVRYDDLAKVSSIVEAIKTLLRDESRIDSDKLLIVGLEKFDLSSVNILVYTYTKETNGIQFYALKQKILLSIAEIIQKNGAEIAFPTQFVYVKQVEN